MMKKKENVKKRSWAFVAYPESLPSDWKEQLQKTGLRCVISPLHDRDINPTGEPKKPHYHVLLCYDGPTTYSNVRAFTNGKLGQTIPQPVEQVRGYYRYLTHEDNPEKAQYSKADIQTLNGFNIRDFCEMTKGEIEKCIREITQFVFDNAVMEYADLMQTLLCGGDSTAEWFEIASSHTMYFTALIKSCRYRIEGHNEQKKDGLGAN